MITITCRLAAEQQEHLENHQEQANRRKKNEEEEKAILKMELEETIWREAEESLRQEFESRMYQEKKKLQQVIEVNMIAFFSDNVV